MPSRFRSISFFLAVVVEARIGGVDAAFVDERAISPFWCALSPFSLCRMGGNKPMKKKKWMRRTLLLLCGCSICVSSC